MKSYNVNQEKIYRLISFMFSFATTAVFTINILYHMKIANLNSLQLVLVGTCLEITCFLLEMPTGIIADKYSRRLSIIIGFALIGCGFILEGSVPSFVSILIAQFIWGTGYTCVSGALDAWVIDETGNDSLFISGAKFSSIGQFSGILVSIAMAQISLQLPIIFGGFSLIILSIILILFMSEKPYKKNSNPLQKNYFSNIFKSIFTMVKSNRILGILFIITLFYGLYSEGFDRLWGMLILQTEELATSDGTYVFGVIAMITAVIGYFTFGRIENRAEKADIYWINKILIFLCIIITLCIGLMTFIRNGYVLVIFVIIINLLRNIIGPFESIWFNKLITDSSTRASILSIRGQLGSLGQIASGPLMGIFSTLMPLRFIFIMSATIFSPTIFLYRYLKKRAEKVS